MVGLPILFALERAVWQRFRRILPDEESQEESFTGKTVNELTESYLKLAALLAELSVFKQTESLIVPPHIWHFILCHCHLQQFLTCREKAAVEDLQNDQWTLLLIISLQTFSLLPVIEANKLHQNLKLSCIMNDLDIILILVLTLSILGKWNHSNRTNTANLNIS